MARRPGRNVGDDQDYAELPDEALRRAVLEHLEADPTVDVSEIDVGVEGGAVRLAGRVGSEVEREAAERIITDLIGLDVVIDELHVEQTAGSGAAGEAGSGEGVTGADVLFGTDPAHGMAGDRPRATHEATRSPRADEAVGRAMEEADRPALRRAATESAAAFKEAMRDKGKGGRS